MDTTFQTDRFSSGCHLSSLLFSVSLCLSPAFLLTDTIVPVYHLSFLLLIHSHCTYSFLRYNTRLFSFLPEELLLSAVLPYTLSLSSGILPAAHHSFYAAPYKNATYLFHTERHWKSSDCNRFSFPVWHKERHLLTPHNIFRSRSRHSSLFLQKSDFFLCLPLLLSTWYSPFSYSVYPVMHNDNSHFHLLFPAPAVSVHFYI